MAPSSSLPPFSCYVEVNPARDDFQCVSLANFAVLHESGIGTQLPTSELQQFRQLSRSEAEVPWRLAGPCGTPAAQVVQA
jgi:hypothetical protein